MLKKYGNNSIEFSKHVIYFVVPLDPKQVKRQVEKMEKLLPKDGTGNEHSSLIYQMGVGRFWAISAKT